MTTDLEAEFDKLMMENKGGKFNAGGKKARGVPSEAEPRGRVGTDDKKHVDSVSAKRKAVLVGPATRPAHADESGAADDHAAPAKRTARGSTEKEWGKGGPVVPFEPLTIPESRYPKKFLPGELVRGDSVWYRGERYYIDYFPTVWTKGTFARIVGICPRPSEDQATFEYRVMQAGVMDFSVPVDSLEKAPVNTKPYSKQPTKTAVERRIEMKKAGVTDIGDEVAIMLRECETLGQVYECASLYVGVSVVDLHTKYDHLNHGQQRMNLGNQLRNWLKKNGSKNG